MRLAFFLLSMVVPIEIASLECRRQGWIGWEACCVGLGATLGLFFAGSLVLWVAIHAPNLAEAKSQLALWREREINLSPPTGYKVAEPKKERAYERTGSPQ